MFLFITNVHVDNHKHKYVFTNKKNTSIYYILKSCEQINLHNKL